MKSFIFINFFLEELYSNKESMTFIEFYDKVEPLFSNYFFNKHFFKIKIQIKKYFSSKKKI